MNLQPILENELVRIRPLREADFEPLFSVAKDSKIWEQHHSKRYLKSEFEAFFKEAIQSEGALTLLDKKQGHIIGSSQFRAVDDFTNGLEIGWSFLARKYWGGLYNKAIKTLMMAHAFQYVDVVIFYIAHDNKRSQRAVEKINAEKIVDTTERRFPIKLNYLTYIIEKAHFNI